jgi:hypothetical protein
MDAICQGCVLGFHDPEFHLPAQETAVERESRMWVLARTYTTEEYIEEGFKEGLLLKPERDWLLNYISDRRT